MSKYDLLQTESGNTVVVALDHGVAKGAVDGFENPRETLESVLEGNPDAIIARAPFAQRFEDLLKTTDTDVILAPDVLTFSTIPGEDSNDDMWTGAFSPEFIRDFDPAGVKVVLNFGRKNTERHRENIEYVVELYEELQHTDIALIIEPVMWGNQLPDGSSTDPQYVTDASRIGWELGADILKIPYTGDPEMFDELLDQIPVPSTILGGPASGSSKSTLEDIEEAMNAGARGVMIGRSIWQTEDPAGMIQAIKQIVHEQQSVDEAVRLAP